MEYDRRRSVKETLMEEIIQTCVETADAARMIRASMAHPLPAADRQEWEQPVDKALAAVVRGDTAGVRRVWPELLRALAGQPLALRGHRPRRQSAADRAGAGLQYILRRFLGCLPRLGLLTETCRLLETAQLMETRHPVGPGGVTEFDRVFEIACKAITECLAISSADWNGEEEGAGRTAAGCSGQSAARVFPPADAVLIDCLEQVIEVLLRCWLSHSRGVRLSVLETVSDSQRWRQLKRFIETLRRRSVHATIHEPGKPSRHFAPGRARIPRNAARAARARRAVSPAGRTRRRHSAGRGRPLAGRRHRGRGRKLRRVRRLQQHHDPVGSRRHALHVVGFSAAAGELRPAGLEPAARGHRPRNAGPLRPRRGRRIWRRAVAERTAHMANEHQKRFDRLCNNYGMRLPSIAEHLAERFIRPLEIDRLCSLIRPAIEELREGRPPTAIGQLEEQIARFTQETLGAGFELPSWLEALEQEVEQVQWEAAEDGRRNAGSARPHSPGPALAGRSRATDSADARRGNAVDVRRRVTRGKQSRLRFRKTTRRRCYCYAEA